MPRLSRDTRLVQLGKRVEEEMEVQPVSDPIAAGTALASIYAQGKCTSADALDYARLLATAAVRINGEPDGGKLLSEATVRFYDELDADVLVCRISAACGSALHTLGEKYVFAFLNPERSGKRYGD